MTEGKPFFSSNISDSTIQEILQRIDENLILRESINHFEKAAEDANISVHLDIPGDFYPLLNDLHASQAPLFVIKGNGPANLLKRLINLPIKILDYKLIGFNRTLLALLERISSRIENLENASNNHGYNQLHSEIGSLSSIFDERFTNLSNSSRAIEERLAKVENASMDVQQQINGIDNNLKSFEEKINHLRNNANDLYKLIFEDHLWLQNIAKDIRGSSDWLGVVNKKIELLAISLREISYQKELKDKLPEPRFTNREAYAELISQQHGILRLNLGCGEKPLHDYINVDMRQIEGAQIIADVRRLPYGPDEVDEIASAHVVEHFREYHFKTTILPYWRSLLKPGGIIRIICPNWKAMIEQLNEGLIDYSFFKKFTFGGQDYEGDDHFAMYTPDTLSVLLSELGFHHIQVLAVDRDNGGCPEMEIIAEK